MAPEEELERLRVQLKEKEEHVHKAAQAGLDLIHQQMELQNKLEEQRVEMTNALEVQDGPEKLNNKRNGGIDVLSILSLCLRFLNKTSILYKRNWN